MSKQLDSLKKDLKQAASPAKAKVLQRFFKTGKGEYGEGDRFLGIVMPVQREIAQNYIDLSYKEVSELLRSSWHEHRMTALLILLYKFKKADKLEQKKIYDLYLKNTRYINNWDLVDVTTPGIVGVYLLDKPRKVLYKMVISKDLWERRIAVLATYSFIKQNGFKDILKIAKQLLNDEHDLIHKAVGWMLREVGKKDVKVLLNFLDKYTREMPRTMLRYAIERLPESKRQYYLKLK